MMAMFFTYLSQAGDGSPFSMSLGSMLAIVTAAVSIGVAFGAVKVRAGDTVGDRASLKTAMEKGFKDLDEKIEKKAADQRRDSEQLRGEFKRDFEALSDKVGTMRVVIGRLQERQGMHLEGDT